MEHRCRNEFPAARWKRQTERFSFEIARLSQAKTHVPRAMRGQYTHPWQNANQTCKRLSLENTKRRERIFRQSALRKTG